MRGVLSAVVNVGIFCGYVFVALWIMPHVKIKSALTRASGVVFFFTCGLTHLHNAAHSLTATPGYNVLLTWHALTNHTVQLAAVVLFVRGLYAEIVKGDGVWPVQVGRG